MGNKYTTVSLPKSLADDVYTFIRRIRYWPSLSSFTREACIEKLERERGKYGE